jgi:hypothetical protein
MNDITNLNRTSVFSNFLEYTVIAIICIIVFYSYWQPFLNGNFEYVKSSVDGNTYQVQKTEDMEESADLLAKIVERLNLLVKHLEKAYPGDERTHMISMNYDPKSIVEGNDDPKYTSYSINKGEKIVLCLRTRDKNNDLMDLNTMMFVVLHEIAHVATKSIGHTDEFWENFKWILEESINIGIYVKQDFERKHKLYCGIYITDSPLEEE